MALAAQDFPSEAPQPPPDRSEPAAPATEAVGEAVAIPVRRPPSETLPLAPRTAAEVLPLEVGAADEAGPPAEEAAVAGEELQAPGTAETDLAETPTDGAAELSAALVAGPPVLIPEGDPASPQFIGPPLVPPFKLLDESVAPGSARTLFWNAGQSFAGGDTVAPVNVVHGTRPGPVLCLTAAVHGDEINGVEIVRRVLNDLNPDRLSGTVIAVPIINLFGFARSSRYLPDRRDLNRFFPGSQFGSVASRIAFSFFHNIAKRCEALVDFHTGSFDRDNLPQVRADLRLPEVLRFSRGFGALPVLHSNGSRGMLRVAATQAGIPAATFEVGAPGIIQVDQVNTAVEAIDSLMHHLGMVPDEPRDQEPQAIFYDSKWVRANAGGLLIANVRLGQRVQRDQRLGVIVDPVRNTEREILSPLYGRVIGMARNQVVLPGFAAFHIGEETSAEQASDAAAAGRIDDEVEEDPDPAAGREPDM
nr:succinylglutamate desuccinylase/aspartoacylase family protein [Lysobacter sp. CAU 1642]